MTGMLEHEAPGLGHNKPSEEDADEIKHGKWERWAKKRTFVRALEGTYSHLYKKLLEEPRVYSSKDHPWKGGPAMYGKHVISPQAVNIVQSIESHIECYAPLNAGQKHGHLNSAVFYVLKGHGHDIHDGRYMKWQAGDVMLVENGCVHQHFNDDENEDCILLVFKAKPICSSLKTASAQASIATCGRNCFLWWKAPATICTGISNGIAWKHSNGNGPRHRRNTSGRAAITSTSRHSRCTSTSPIPARNA